MALNIEKTTVAIIAISSLLFGSVSASASQVVKHNSPCKQINQIVTVKDVTYKCASVGKKRVWRAIARKSSGNSSNSANTPTPNPSLGDSATVNSLASSFYDWAAKNGKEASNHIPIVNNDVPPKTFSIINPSEVRASKIFAGIISDNTYSFMSVDDSWFFGQGSKYNQLVPPGDGRVVCFEGQSAVAGCTNKAKGIFYNLLRPELSEIVQHRALGAHEFFHLVQSKLGSLSPFVERTIPRWFEEGSAEFVGYAVLALESKTRYEDIVAKLPSSNDLDKDPYGAGRVAIEYLVKTYGFEKILDLFADYSSNTNFDQIFLKNFGITVSDLRTKM